MYKSTRSVCQCYVNALPALCPVNPDVYRLYGASWWVPVPGSKGLGHVGDVAHYKLPSLIDFARTSAGASCFRGNLSSAREFDTNNDDQVTAFELMHHVRQQGVVTAEFMRNVPRCMVTNAALHLNDTVYWFRNVIRPGPYTPNLPFLDSYRAVRYMRPCRDFI